MILERFLYIQPKKTSEFKVSYVRWKGNEGHDELVNWFFLGTILLSDGQPMCRGTLVCTELKPHESYDVCGFGHGLTSRCDVAQKRLATTA